MSNNKRVLPVAVLLTGMLAGAGWMAVSTLAHRQTEPASVAHVLTTGPTTSTTTTVSTTTSAKPKPTTSKPKPTKRHTTTQTSGAQASVSSSSVTRAIQSVDGSTTSGVLVYDRQSGKTLLSTNSTRRFHSASLVKLLIAIDVLHSGADSDSRSKLAYMLKMSDDNLASTFWVRQGGAPLVTREAQRLGLHETAPPTPAGQWGNTWLSPRDLLTIYQYILNDMTSADRDLIVSALANAPEHASDGYDQWFGIPDGQSAQWAIKQGWSSSGTDRCWHSTGLVGKGWRYVVVVLTEHPLSTGSRTGTSSVTAGVRALAPLIN